jgi:F0F1-type ATP synthase membrane subunit a
MAHDPMDHVLDTRNDPNHSYWPIFETLFGGFEIPLLYVPDFFGKGHPLRITKFMILEVLAAVLVVLVYVPLARKMKNGELPRGTWWNLWETLLTFVRDQIAKPNLQEDADRYTPFLWTAFLFILFCNLLGLVPVAGSPTASIFATLGLACFSLVLFNLGGIAKLGVLGYLGSMWPAIEIVPFPGKRHKAADHHDGHGHTAGHEADTAHGPSLLGRILYGPKGPAHGHHEEAGHAPAAEEPPAPWYLWPLWLVAAPFGFVIGLVVFLIEFAGVFIRSAVLALRLFVNIFAGHMILASILLLIVTVGNAVMAGQASTPVWGLTTVISVLAVTVLSLLELFVAFLQAFVFTFLTAVFLGMATHPSH